jgi:hypothetical protein
MASCDKVVDNSHTLWKLPNPTETNQEKKTGTQPNVIDQRALKSAT